MESDNKAFRERQLNSKEIVIDRFVSGSNTSKLCLIARLRTISRVLNIITVRQAHTSTTSLIYLLLFLENTSFPCKQTRRQILRESLLKVIAKISVKKN